MFDWVLNARLAGEITLRAVLFLFKYFCKKKCSEEKSEMSFISTFSLENWFQEKRSDLLQEKILWYGQECIDEVIVFLNITSNLIIPTGNKTSGNFDEILHLLLMQI